MSALPSRSTATQNEALGHETERRRPFGSMLVGTDQDDPSKVSALPKSSTAAQNEALAHETGKRWPFGSMLAGTDQEDPLKVIA